jgi:hypothetical protein
MAEWYFTTYLIYPAIFMVHADDDDDDNNDDDDDDDTDTFKGDVSCPSFEFVYIYFSVALFMCFRPCPNG